jgi:serine/threonine-protein kinase
MLAGKGPFDHTTSHVAVITAHLTETPLAPSKVAQIPISSALDAVVLKALEKDPGLRIQTAREFDSLLSEVAKNPEPPVSAVSAAARSPGESGRSDPTHPTDTSFVLPVSARTAFQLSALAWVILVGVALLTAVLIIVFGRQYLLKHGGS